MSKLDGARSYRATATTEMPDGKLYYGPIWERNGVLFVLYGNKQYTVEKGIHWQNWKVKYDVIICGPETLPYHPSRNGL